MIPDKYNVVVVFQHENWEDDGGDHDPLLRTVSADLFYALEEAANTEQLQEYDELHQGVRDSTIPSLPCTLDGVFNIWYGY